jgi:hypothetical protein
VNLKQQKNFNLKGSYILMKDIFHISDTKIERIREAIFSYYEEKLISQDSMYLLIIFILTEQIH